MANWSTWHKNPFAAVGEVATFSHICAVSQVFSESMRWENFDYDHYLDDLFQEIAGKTNIVIQYDRGEQAYRAAYDD